MSCEVPEHYRFLFGTCNCTAVMSRNYSIATSSMSNESKGGVREIEDIGQGADLEIVRSRHVGIGRCTHPSLRASMSLIRVVDEPHYHADAQREAFGFDLDEEINIVDWNGPDDPENPYVLTRRHRTCMSSHRSF